MTVYSFYYAKSRVVHTIDWDGKRKYERLAIVMIIMMGVVGLAFFWLPIPGFQYTAFLVNGECELVERRWALVVWTLGDTILSIFLLVLFIKPLQEVKKILRDTPKSRETMLKMKGLILKNRNILTITVLSTLIVMMTIGMIIVINAKENFIIDDDDDNWYDNCN